MPVSLAPVTIDAHGRHAQAVAFTPDGKLLLSVGQDQVVRVWSVPRFAAAGAWKGHKKSTNTLSLSNDGRGLATSSTDKTVRLWSVPDGRSLLVLERAGLGLLSPDGRRLVTTGANGEYGLRALDAPNVVTSIEVDDRRLLAASFAPDGNVLFLGGSGPAGETGPIHRIDGVTGRLIRSFEAHEGPVLALRVTRNGRTLVSTGEDGTLRSFEIRSGKPGLVLPIERKGMLTAAFVDGEKRVAVAVEHAILIVDLKKGTVSEEIEVGPKGVSGLAASADGKWLAAASADGKVRVWDRSRPGARS